MSRDIVPVFFRLSRVIVPVMSHDIVPSRFFAWYPFPGSMVC